VAPRYRYIGSGITKRPTLDLGVLLPNHKSGVVERRDTIRQFNEERSWTLDGAIAECLEWARETSAEQERLKPEERDTIKWDYAERILKHHQIVRFEIDRGNADKAALWGGRLFEIMTELRFKLDWEKPAISGEQRRATLSATAASANQRRHNTRATEWEAWQVRASDTWARNPALSKRAVARIVQAALKPVSGGKPVSVRTIEDRIKKPHEAG
jgi:hypothetical protein